MVRIFLYFFISIIFLGCSAKEKLDVDKTGFSKHYDTIMKIVQKCEDCSSADYEIIIDGHLYRSDVPLKCCSSRKIDSSAGLKKVFLHSVFDLGSKQKFIKVQDKAYVIDRRFDTIFYLALKQELYNRGILVVANGDSPYTLKVDFDFTGFSAIYSSGAKELRARLKGILNIKDINYNRNILVSTTQSVSDLSVKNASSFSPYIDLLVRQAANKVAEQISKF